MRQNAGESGLALFSFDDVCLKGNNSTDRTFKEPSPDDVMLLSYTSGTTGNPKGVKITHKMMVGVSCGLQTRFGDTAGASERDTYISYLPSAHVFE